MSYWGYNPLILTFDPNFLGHPSRIFLESFTFGIQLVGSRYLFQLVYPFIAGKAEETTTPSIHQAV